MAESGPSHADQPTTRRRRTLAAVAGGLAIIVLVAVIVAVRLGGGSPVVSTTTDTPVPPAPNPAAMPVAGTMLWSTLTGRPAQLPRPVYWAVSLAGGTAVIAPGIGNLNSEAGDAADTVLGIDAQSGAARWQWRRVGWRLEAISASAADGVAATLWITNPANGRNDSGGNFSYALTVLDLRTGRLDWTAGGVGTGASGGRVVIVGSEVVALAADAASAFTASSGRPLWRRAAPTGCAWGVDTGTATGSEITLGDAAVFPYVCRNGSPDAGGIARLAPATGATIWQRPLPGRPLALAQAAGSVAVIDYDAASNDAVARAFDAATGEQRWNTAIFRTEQYAGMLAVDRTGGVYVLTAVGNSPSEVLVRVNGADGRVRWSAPLGPEYLALSVGVVGGQVVLGGVNSTGPDMPELRLFSAATGTLLARQSTPQMTVLQGRDNVRSDWDAALTLEPGLAVLSSSGNHDVLGAFSLPQLTGTP